MFGRLLLSALWAGDIDRLLHDAPAAGAAVQHGAGAQQQRRRSSSVPRTHNKLGDRSFSAAGPRLWNDLQSGLRRPGLTFRLFQTIFENSFIWRPKRLVTVLNV